MGLGEMGLGEMVLGEMVLGDMGIHPLFSQRNLHTTLLKRLKHSINSLTCLRTDGDFCHQMCDTEIGKNIQGCRNLLI
jgi:hypothetical protein